MRKSRKNFLSRQKTAEPILKRSAVFLACFVIVSGLLGPRIISHGLVDKYGFEVYGGAGKALLFGVLALLLFIQRKQAFPELALWRLINVVWLGAAAASLCMEWHLLSSLIALTSPGVMEIIAAHMLILITVLSLLIFSFGLGNLRLLFRIYKTELLYALAMAVAFFGFLYAVYGLWRLLSVAVLRCVKVMLGWVGVQSVFISPLTLIFNKFGISISEYCSGIDSIALFTALYGLIGVLDWRRFNHKKYLAVFLPALVILFGFNILRVFVLILAGYYIDPQIAFSLFHTYAGMVFFIIYSALFWGISYKWMLSNSVTKLGYTTEK